MLLNLIIDTGAMVAEQSFEDYEFQDLIAILVDAIMIDLQEGASRGATHIKKDVKFTSLLTTGKVVIDQRKAKFSVQNIFVSIFVLL